MNPYEETIQMLNNVIPKLWQLHAVVAGCFLFLMCIALAQGQIPWAVTAFGAACYAITASIRGHPKERP